MLNLFRTNQLLGNLLLVPYAILLRLGYFWNVTEHEQSSEAIAIKYLPDLSTASWLSFIISTLLLALTGSLINSLLASNRVDRIVTLLPGMSYVLAAALPLAEVGFSPWLVVHLCSVLMLYNLWGSFRLSKASTRLFNAGWWIAIGSLFIPAATLLLLPVMVGMGILRSLRIKELLQALIGFVVPYILVATALFLWGDFSEDWTAHWGQMSLAINFIEGDFYTLAGITAWYSILLGMTLLNADLYRGTRNMGQHKKVDIIFWLLLTAPIILIFKFQISALDWLAVVFPLGILMGLSFNRLNPRLAEAIHLILVATLLVWQFRSLLLGPIG